MHHNGRDLGYRRVAHQCATRAQQSLCLPLWWPGVQLSLQHLVVSCPVRHLVWVQLHPPFLLQVLRVELTVAVLADLRNQLRSVHLLQQVRCGHQNASLMVAFVFHDAGCPGMHGQARPSCAKVASLERARRLGVLESTTAVSIILPFLLKRSRVAITRQPFQ
jgi:hypothetical protein